MSLIPSLVAFALLGAPDPGLAANAPAASSNRPGAAVAEAPAAFFRFGFFAGFALDGAHFDVGGEWTSSKPFFVEVPLNPICYIRLFVARNVAPGPEDHAVAARRSN